jgi:hypothetical protein
MTDKKYSSREAATYLGMSVSTLNRLVSEGIARPTSTGPGRLGRRYTRKNLDRMRERRRREALALQAEHRTSFRNLATRWMVDLGDYLEDLATALYIVEGHFAFIAHAAGQAGDDTSQSEMRALRAQWLPTADVLAEQLAYFEPYFRPKGEPRSYSAALAARNRALHDRDTDGYLRAMEALHEAVRKRMGARRRRESKRSVSIL